MAYNHDEQVDFYVCPEFYVSEDHIKARALDYRDLTKKSIFIGKIYLIVTYWTYPFGGGEEFMYDTMEWASNLGMKSYWLAFTDPKSQPFEEFKVRKNKFGDIIHVPGGFSVETLSNWLYLIRPDIVHHQGHLRAKFYMAAEPHRFEFISGFHFWGGGIILDSEKKNILMLENARYHKTDPEFEMLCGKDRMNFYCASRYVQECFEKITNTYIEDIILPSSSVERYMLKGFDPWVSPDYKPNNNPEDAYPDRGYVVMINIHKHKGGSTFYYLLKSCPKVKFMCVRTEFNSEELDRLIENEIDRRNAHPDTYEPCIFMERTRNVKEIYSKAKIIMCTSLVDETFCRVVNEAMMNGIPVLTTHRGNIQYLVGDTTPVLDPNDPQEWEKEINRIYFNEAEYRTMSDIMRQKYAETSEDRAKEQFKSVMRKTILKSKEMNVGIFSPWCDQGLGIQSRNYYKTLESSKHFKPSVFALKPYNAETCQELQRNPDEWEVDRIYYSPNSREDVKDTEILEFCRKYNIGKMIMPETCWPRIFQVAKLLREISVKAYAVPNIEIVRRDEIFKHNYFYKVLCNNYLCERVFTKLDIPANYVGYAIEGMEFKRKTYEGGLIKFLFIGGMNAFSRKHVLEVCEAFAIAYQENHNLRLTVTVQMTNSLESDLKQRINEYIDHPGIDIIQKHMSYSKIIDMYYSHHIGVQVSKHEGLGLGFYEGISTGTPVLTLKTPPHNEIILDGVNGWTVNCTYKEMKDNTSSLFGSAYFDPKALAAKMIQIGNRNEIEKIVSTLEQDNKTRLSLETFSMRFLNELL